MTTREEQVAAAERIAALNPEWTLWPSSTFACVIATDSYEVALDAYRGWEAWDKRNGVLRDEFRRILYFDSPSAAIRALGYSIKESPDE